MRELCILDHGVAMYMVQDGLGGFVEADFMRDRQERLVMSIYDREPESAFFLLFIHALGHLTRSVLQIHDLHRRYGTFEATDDLIDWGNTVFNYEREPSL